MNIFGFDHQNRGVGVRHHQLILPSVVCSTHVARRIADQVGAVTFAHQHGCGIIGDDVAGIDNFFAELADHPNVGSVLIVSLGCETIQGQELGAKLAARNPSTKYQIIQESGGVEGTVSAGVAAARELSAKYGAESAPVTDLLVGIDVSRETPLLQELITELTRRGIRTVSVETRNSSAQNFSTLMREKAAVIVSFPAENQPASGFPLIPVINISSTSVLHQAIASDFDLGATVTAIEIAEKVWRVANKQETISEKNHTGEILAPRMVRSA